MPFMALVPVDLPSPADLRGGWAALAAVEAAQGWDGSVWATDDDWYYNDGGGNWAAIRFQEGDRAVLIGHDHECSKTYFRPLWRSTVVDTEETDLLSGAPDWWGKSLEKVRVIDPCRM